MNSFVPHRRGSPHSRDYRRWAANSHLHYFQRMVLVPWVRTRMVYALDEPQAGSLFARDKVHVTLCEAVPHSHWACDFSGAEAGSEHERRLRKITPFGYATAQLWQPQGRRQRNAAIKPRLNPAQRSYRQSAIKQGKRLFREDSLTCCYTIERAYAPCEAAAIVLMDSDSNLVEEECGTVTVPPARLVRSAAAGSDAEIILRGCRLDSAEAVLAARPSLLQLDNHSNPYLTPQPAADWRAPFARIRGVGKVAGIRVHDAMGRA